MSLEALRLLWCAYVNAFRSSGKGLTARNRAIPATRFPRRRSRASGAWFQATHLGDQFIRAHPLGKTVADRDNTDVRGLVLLRNGFQPGLDLLRIAIDIRATKLGDIRQLLGSIAIGQGSFHGWYWPALPQGTFELGQVTAGGQPLRLCLGLSTQDMHADPNFGLS